MAGGQQQGGRGIITIHERMDITRSKSLSLSKIARAKTIMDAMR
jgi:hypothetical protein